MRDPLKEPRYGDVFCWNPPPMFGATARPRVVMFLTTEHGGWVGLCGGDVGHSWFPLDYNKGREADSGYWTVKR